MKSARIVLGLVLAINLICPGWSFAQPKIPKANIQADIPAAVKKEIEQLYSKDPVKRGYATLHLKGMGGRGTPAIPFLVTMLGEQVDLQRTGDQGGGRLFWEPSVSIGALAGEALGAMGDPGINALLTSLKNDNADIRANAARGLGEGKAQRAVEPLILALHDKSSLVRRWAAYALGQIKDERAVEPLLLALKDKSKSVREAAARSLRNFKDNGNSAALILMLKDPDEDVRTAAAGSLGELKHPASVKPLIAALNDKDATVRYVAAEALGEIKDRQASLLQNAPELSGKNRWEQPIWRLRPIKR
jgi:HEAT repeat protein